MSRRLFFDIEVSYNLVATWAIGRKVFIGPESIVKERAIICICYKWEGDPRVYSFSWDRAQCDKTMLGKFVKVMDQADEIVAQNGDNFDIKWIRTRCAFHRLPCAPDYVSIDTLKECRKVFRMNSNKLDYVGQYLGVGKKVRHRGKDMWDDVALRNDRKALKEMIGYCEGDVRLLEAVHKVLIPYTKAKTHRAIHEGGVKSDCPECTSTHTKVNQYRTSSSGVKHAQMHCMDCGKYFRVALTTLQAIERNKKLDAAKEKGQ